MKQILLIIAVVALVGCGESKKAAEARAAAEAQVAAEAKAASLRRQNQTKVKSEKTLSPEAAAAALAKKQSEIIEEAVRTHLHAKTGFAAGKEIKGELT